jgi:hypothetical protein
MQAMNEIKAIHLLEDNPSGVSRRLFLKNATLTGATTLAALGGLATPASAAQQEEEAATLKAEHDHLKKSDRDILVAAEIAEALAVTTYSNIINIAPFFQTIPADDQGYLVGARQEEMSHYLLEQSVTDQPTPFTQFFYPPKMFFDAQTTLNILVTLEDAFIAAYLIGVRNFSTTNLRVTAARIMGIESDHRTLARVVGGDVTPQFGGPIGSITGIQGVAESIAPSNNNGLRKNVVLDVDQSGVERAHALCGLQSRQSCWFRHVTIFPVRTLHPDSSESAWRFHFLQRVLKTTQLNAE